MRPRRWILLCAALAALPDSAIGQTEPASATGSALFVSCQANEPRCGAYLQGVLDMMIVARKAECRAPRYDRSALRAAYLRWAEQNSYFMSVHMRSEEHTSELQSLMRISYAVFCLKKKRKTNK